MYVTTMPPTPSPLNPEGTAKETSRILSKSSASDPESKLFEDAFEWILEDIATLQGDPNGNIGSQWEKELNASTKYVEKVMQYNVPHGKKLRGKMVVMVYQSLVPGATEEQMKLVRVLGWCAEILQAAYLVADDIMDNGETRRGQICWYRVENNGTNALNDAFLLEHLAYQILEKYFGQLECYYELLNLLLGVTYKTILGQSMDIRASKDRNFSLYNMELYKSIVTYKTGYYTVYLPVALAMVFAGLRNKGNDGNKALWLKMEQVTLEIGQLFQIQDDFFDCFGEEEVIGKKVGTDIEEGKCTWLFVKAKEISMEGNTLEKLNGNYGSTNKEKVETIKKLYKQLNLPQVFTAYQEKAYDDIVKSIKELRNSNLEQVLFDFLNLLYKRAC